MHRHLFDKLDPHAILEIYNMSSFEVGLSSLDTNHWTLSLPTDQYCHDHAVAVMSLSCHDRQLGNLCVVEHLLLCTYPIITTFVGISCVTFTVRGCPSFTCFLGFPACFIGPTYTISLDWFGIVYQWHKLHNVIKLIWLDWERASPTQCHKLICDELQRAPCRQWY